MGQSLAFKWGVQIIFNMIIDMVKFKCTNLLFLFVRPVLCSLLPHFLIYLELTDFFYYSILFSLLTCQLYLCFVLGFIAYIFNASLSTIKNYYITWSVVQEPYNNILLFLLLVFVLLSSDILLLNILLIPQDVFISFMLNNYLSKRLVK